MPETLIREEQRVYSEKEIDDIRWGLRGLKKKMAPPYHADKSIREGDPLYENSKYKNNWFTGLFGYAEPIILLCRDARKRDSWQQRIDTIKWPMKELHAGTPPDNTEEVLQEAEVVAGEIIAYFESELPMALAA